MAKHTCHYPGCNKEVPPKLWGCKPHWFRLPKALRDEVWRTYRPGQEIDKKPSAAYLKVADEVQRWCLRSLPGTALPPTAEEESYRSAMVAASAAFVKELGLSAEGALALVVVIASGKIPNIEMKH